MINIYSNVEITQASREIGLTSHQLRLLRNGLFKHQLGVDEAFETAAIPAGAGLRENLRSTFLELVDRSDSKLDGASKLIFRTDAGLHIEAVILRIHSGRTALCISCQVGCAAKCAFCATGKMGIARDLTVGEILDQVVQANRLLREEGRRVRNIVFMGMGEPFHNEAGIYRAIELLCSTMYFNLSPKHVAVSTVGIPHAMVRFVDRFPDVSMALSLHSARQDARERLIPLAKRYPLDQLHSAIRQVTSVQNRPIMVEYLLLNDVNDRDADASALIDYLAGIPVHINLIPFNPIDGLQEFSPSPLERRWAFARLLRAAGLRVTMRYSLGSDIAAACGQLAKRRGVHLPASANVVDAASLKSF